MSDTPKFTVIDRRKFRGTEEGAESAPAETVTPAEPTAATPPAPAAGPRLVTSEPTPEPAAEVSSEPVPGTPTDEEIAEQLSVYKAASERLDDLIRAQNPGAEQQPQEQIGFPELVQQFYLSALMQLGAGTPEGQRPRVDIVGARQTIDLLGILAEKTRGNVTETEQQLLSTMLFDLRAAFANVIQMSRVSAPTPTPGFDGGNF